MAPWDKTLIQRIVRTAHISDCRHLWTADNVYLRNASSTSSGKRGMKCSSTEFRGQKKLSDSIPRPPLLLILAGTLFCGLWG